MEALNIASNFTKYYIGVHSGRRLTWQSNLGTAELRCMFEGGRKELIVHTYQVKYNEI
jgi:cullin 3